MLLMYCSIVVGHVGCTAGALVGLATVGALVRESTGAFVAPTNGDLLWGAAGPLVGAAAGGVATGALASGAAAIGLLAVGLVPTEDGLLAMGAAAADGALAELGGSALTTGLLPLVGAVGDGAASNGLLVGDFVALVPTTSCSTTRNTTVKEGPLRSRPRAPRRVVNMYGVAVTVCSPYKASAVQVPASAPRLPHKKYGALVSA